MNLPEPVDPGFSSRHFEITADSAWDDVQAQYRRLVQQWHPDRHPQGTRDEAQAEFIEIVASFKRLRRHYGEHGRLPTVPPTSAASYTVSPEGDEHGSGSGLNVTPTSLRPPTQRTRTLRSILRSPATAILAVFLLASALGGFVFLLDQQLAGERREQARIAQEADQPASANSPAEPEPHAAPVATPSTNPGD